MNEKASNKKTANDDLAEQIGRTREFLKQENLSKLILKYEGEIALLVVDVQKEFCDPQDPHRRGTPETVKVSERIQSLVPAFRDANIPVYAVYYSADGEKPADEIDFFKFTPEEGDTLVAKSTDSAFRSGNLKDLLTQRNHGLLLACGFNQAACLKETVIDARYAGFEVCLLEDLVGNDRGCAMFEKLCDAAARDMEFEGAVPATSKDVLKYLRP